ncbi:Murein DD-endopeptidase MepM and murein hydrolase activator NlpD, contain LysM domain [Limimonas halophila]|uniref:Murein DD-endopeptidase MepM and murein hydrolase activator NlpD, contain LysM domain n=1 Tax=Limimonas halophila TaxID=1082479 RepID=A0A1G7NHI1_9PROT|nr:LysM peptidoglycan-binding domain-containing M23 family metallopeptidase [Limimonas halophila]SDF73381.1 Murein DD-endopeptidase MepM and murein hydrolase activator NlpD, contain LysM domain [Limimonas halophila]
MRERRLAEAHPGRTAACLLAAGLAVAACSRSGGPAPVEYGQGGEPRRSAGQAGNASGQTVRGGTEAGEPGVHTVRKGQTVYGIARRYGVSIRAVIDANDLSPPYDLRIGQELRIPVPERYVVQRGDTLYSISRRFGVDMNALARRNDIGPPYLIHPGDVLTVPDGDATRVAETRQRERETVRGDADRKPETGTADRETSDSGGGGDVVRASAEPEARVTVPIPDEKPRAIARRQRRDEGREAETRQAAADADRSAAPVSDPPARSAGSFLWPVKGEVIADYGPQNNGLHNDGVNIAAPSGTAIRAAANGVVAYVGDDLKGFGKLVLVKHADGWITAYAHAAAIIVDRGDRVERGQPLARVGSSGNVSRPQLHFEVRKGSQAIDPQEVMATTRASRSGTSAG